MKITTLIAVLLLLIIGITATGCGVYYYDRDDYPGNHRDYYNHHYDRDHDNDHGRGDRW